MRPPKILFAAILFSITAAAADKPLDVTITVVESPADLPAAVTKRIELPTSASDRAHDASLHGLDIANEARALRREAGQSVAEQAKDKGRNKDARKGRP